jgi:membrane-bound serine protease (ClpP class)
MQKFAVCLLLMLALFMSRPVSAQEKAGEKQYIYVLSLEGEIFEGLAQRIKSKLARVDPKLAKIVILEINTPGGGVGYVLDICEDIDRLAQSGVPVYAYVTGKAWSGGALVSLACDRIYMKKDTSIGSAQVKILTPLGVQDADEKAMSAMRATFRARAQARDYPPALAEAMVDPALEVREIMYRGARYFKTPEDIQNLRNQPAVHADDIVEKRIVVKAGELANFTYAEAKEYGFCKEVYASRDELIKGLGLSQLEVREINMTSGDILANLLSNQWVRFFLLALGILGILIEFMSPGLGFPGIIGLACVALFFVGGYLGEVTAVWEIVLFILGLALLAIEVFVLPGFGVVGIAGILCCFLSLLLSFQNFILPSNKQQSDLLVFNVFIILLGIGMDVVLLLVISKFLPESAPLQRLSVAAVQRSEDGYSVAVPGFQKLQGLPGVATSSLRPAGRAEIQGESYDVVSQGDFIVPGEKIQVVEIQGNRIIVDKVRG